MKKPLSLARPSLFAGVIFAFCLSPFAFIKSQTPAKPNSADLLQNLKKLQVLGSVLYVAAHPDDENTRMISYLVNEKLYTVTYLSLTRGDGGQNLIGPEIRELLGVIRTEELMAARRIDGGQQLFSRANDYGYSKKPSEAFRTWNRAEVTEDVVWAFRKTQPDVVINRFTTDTSFDNHGHHTASAILSAEVFDLAGRRDIFPDQFKFGVAVWQPKRIFFNTSWWFYGSREKFEAADKSNLWSLDLGVFLPLKGRSNTEIAAESRSMHRCQGFGSIGTRGESKEYLDFLKGEKPKTDDIFEGVNTTWTRVAGGEKIGKALAAIEENFKFDKPAAALPELIKVEKAITELPDGFWKKTKLAEIRALIKGCAGLWLEAIASDASATPGEKIKVKMEVISRMAEGVKLSGFSIQPGLLDSTLNFDLIKNKGIFIEKSIEIPSTAKTTAPYWLLENFDIGMYKVPDQTLRGLPETPRFSKVIWKMEIAGRPFDFETDLLFKKEVPERGEIYQPFEALPPVTVSIAKPNYIFYKREKQIEVKVRAGKDQIAGTATLELPAGWKAEPAVQNFDIKKKGADKSLIFNVLAPEKDSEGWARAVATVDGKTFSQRLVSINYEHIPVQSVLLPATSKIARADVRTTAKKIGYYMGAGDEVPEALRQIGCEVDLLDDENFPSVDILKNYDAIVVGIRAYNAKDNVVFHHEKFLEYARTGGTLVVQYNTTGDLSIKDIAPFSMKIGRDRVTMEDAPVRILKPDHAVLNTPNKIASKDFDNWFQERGLYFPSEWGPEFDAVLSMNDPNEKAKDGSLLVARYGTGWYVYTGISFFRELPAGVPGAYRLFANLISLGKNVP